MNKEIRVITEFELINEEMQSLVLLYQPVFSFNALSLYLTLYKMGRNDHKLDEKTLVHMLKMPVDDIVLQRQELEQLNLASTYKNNHYTIVLKKPLTPREFLQHPMYGRLYSIVCGQDALKSMVLKYVSAPLKIGGEDISKRFDPNRLAVWDEKLENEFAKQDADVKDTTPVSRPFESKETASISEAVARMSEDLEPRKPRFDVEMFFDGIPNIVYPVDFRTPQLKRLIEEVGTLFDVDFETMKRFMINSSNFESKRFDTKKFVYLLEKEFGRMQVDEDNPYDVDPVSFIRFKQGYEYVVGSDQNLVKSLTENFGFNTRVVNFLVEYVLDVNDNNLNRAYVEKIASTWKRNGVETLEDAMKQVQPKTQRKHVAKAKNIAEMPEYTTEETLSDEEEAALRASIQAMLQEDED